MNRSTVALILELAALVMLSLALLDVAWLDARAMPRLAVLVDRSFSMPQPAVDAALRALTSSLKSADAAEVEVLEFAGRPGSARGESTDSLSAVEPSATNIERALDAALAAHARRAYSGALVISDGFETAGETVRALQAAREARLPIHWLAMGRPPPDARIVNVLAPQRATAGQPILLTVDIHRPLQRQVRVTASARDAGGAVRSVQAEPDGDGRARLELIASGEGAVLVDIALEDSATGERLQAQPKAAAIDVTAQAAMLYVQGSGGALSRSLTDGGWKLNVVPASRADAHARRLAGYKVIVLDDVAVTDAGEQFWRALVAAVEDHGVGLVVLGGERSFTRGGYRDSTLESLLPVVSEPAALDQPASVLFLVDKSGSMGQGSAGVDRFRLAQRAVLETARGLSDRDTLGVMVFDLEPRVLIPIGPARARAQALARDWQASPRGGTRLAPALEMAIAELEGSAVGRRMLVLVTDGFVENAPLLELRARLAGSGIETIALAVGADADVPALEKLVGKDTGLVYRVNEAAELPLVMRSALERRRARVERGTIAVKQVEALPFPPATLKNWPTIDAYAATRLRPRASTPVQSARGDPLVAWQISGRGRVIAVTCGVADWTPRWLTWREWPRFAGGLAHWASATPDQGTVALKVSSIGTGAHVEADVRSPAGWADHDGVSITVKTEASETRVLPADDVAPGRLRAKLPEADGTDVYTIVVASPHGTQRMLHLRRSGAEDDSFGTSPAIDSWKQAGLVSEWNPASLSQLRSAPAGNRQPDRWLVGAALGLFLAGVVIDRTRVRFRWRVR